MAWHGSGLVILTGHLTTHKMPSHALVKYGYRYGSRAIGAYGRYQLGKYRMAGYAARAAYRYGPRAIRAGARLVRWARRRKSKWHRRSVPSAPSAKSRFEYLVQNSVLSQRKLYVKAIEFQPSNTQANIFARQSLNCWLSGIKVCEKFWLPVVTAGEIPVQGVELHWALVQAKHEVRPTDLPSYKNVIMTDFFSAAGALGSNASTRDFIEPTTGSNYDFGYQCDGLNKQNVHVISHRRRYMEPPSTAVLAQGRNRAHIRKYFKLGKRFAFWDMNDAYGKHPIFLLTWWQVRDANQWDPLTAYQQDWVYTTRSIKTYYR